MLLNPIAMGRGFPWEVQTDVLGITDCTSALSNRALTLFLGPQSLVGAVQMTYCTDEDHFLER
jgi:hypothetical protein